MATSQLFLRLGRAKDLAAPLYSQIVCRFRHWGVRRWRKQCEYETTVTLTFRHRASSILGQAFRYSPENAFYIFNQ